MQESTKHSISWSIPCRKEGISCQSHIYSDEYNTWFLNGDYHDFHAVLSDYASNFRWKTISFGRRLQFAVFITTTNGIFEDVIPSKPKWSGRASYWRLSMHISSMNTSRCPRSWMCDRNNQCHIYFTGRPNYPNPFNPVTVIPFTLQGTRACGSEYL